MPVPRVINAVLGLWLFASAFLFGHPFPQFWAAAGAGLVITAVAFASGTFPGAAYLNTVVAAFLFSFTMSRAVPDRVTRLHDAAVAVLVFAMALIPWFSRSDQEMREA